MKIFQRILFLLSLTLSLPAFAATPSEIALAGRKTTLLGTEYQVYNVRCSDGSQKKISAWDKKTKWCEGDSDSKCHATQLKAAAAVCK